jgi:hypothetical protein
MLEALILLGLGFGAYKLAGGSSSPSGLPPTAPVPPLPQNAAPAIAGHVIPHPPATSREAANGFLSGISFGGVRFQDRLPWPDSMGIWRDGKGVPWQFRDCNDQPIGVPGYMPLEYQADLASGLGCDGAPFVAVPASSAGGLDPAAQTAIQVGTTAAVAAGTAAASGASVGGAVAGAATAALAALGPLPDGRAGWRSSTVETLVVEHADRVLGVNVFRATSSWCVAAVETSAAAFRAHGAPGLGAMYGDHAHRVIGDFTTNHEARRAAVVAAEAWLADRARLAPCPCPEIRA